MRAAGRLLCSSVCKDASCGQAPLGTRRSSRCDTRRRRWLRWRRRWLPLQPIALLDRATTCRSACTPTHLRARGFKFWSRIITGASAQRGQRIAAATGAPGIGAANRRLGEPRWAALGRRRRPRPCKPRLALSRAWSDRKGPPDSSARSRRRSCPPPPQRRSLRPPLAAVQKQGEAGPVMSPKSAYLFLYNTALCVAW